MRLGRIKLAVRRELILSNGRPITICQVLQRGYPRQQRLTAWHYLAARRALRKEAIVIARYALVAASQSVVAEVGHRHQARENLSQING